MACFETETEGKRERKTDDEPRTDSAPTKPTTDSPPDNGENNDEKEDPLPRTIVVVVIARCLCCDKERVLEHLHQNVMCSRPNHHHHQVVVAARHNDLGRNAAASAASCSKRVVTALFLQCNGTYWSHNSCTSSCVCRNKSIKNLTASTSRPDAVSHCSVRWQQRFWTARCHPPGQDG